MNVELLFDVTDFIKSLEKSTIAKVLHLIDLLEKFGNSLDYPHSRKISEKIFELRVRGNQEVRILYSFHGKNNAIVLHAFVKKTNKTPKRELETALRRLASF